MTGMGSILAPLHPTDGLTPVVWYAPVSIVLWAYLGTAAVMFLALFRPRTQRGLVANGIFAMAVGLVIGAVRSIWLLAFTGRPASLFSSEFQAVVTVAPLAAFACGVSCWLLWRIRAGRERRRSGAGIDLLS